MPDVLGPTLNQEQFNAVMNHWRTNKGIGPFAWSEWIAKMSTALYRIAAGEHDPQVIEEEVKEAIENEHTKSAESPFRRTDDEVRQSIENLHGIDGCACTERIARAALKEASLPIPEDLNA